MHALSKEQQTVLQVYTVPLLIVIHSNLCMGVTLCM